jgi:hypothetical protein
MDADRIRVARSRRRAPLLKSVGASERLSAGYVPRLERSGATEGSNPVPSSAESGIKSDRCRTQALCRQERPEFTHPVLSEPEPSEPTTDIHGRTPRAPNGSLFG